MTADDLAALVEGIAPVVRDVSARACADLLGKLADLRERVAVLETRPPGDAAGLEFVLEQSGDATVTLKAIRGEAVSVIGTATFPIQRFVGDYEPGHAYTPGNIVRAKHALWHCRAATTLAPDAVTYDASGAPAGPQGKDCWTLLLRDGKRGSEGKAGAPGLDGKPGRDWQQVYDETRRR
jgi:hypothetical protein